MANWSLFGRRDLLGLTMTGVALGTLGPLARGARAQGTNQGAKLKIATIGAGREGGAIGTILAKQGHPVMFSSRNPDQLKELVEKAGPNARAGSVAEAVAFGDAVLLVVPFTAIEQIGKDHGKALAAKVLVMDVSNPIPRRDGEDFVKQVNAEGGAGVVTQKLIPGAHLVRGFNAIGSGQLTAEGHRAGEMAGVPIAGNDPKAIEVASALSRELGFEPVLVGDLAMGKYLRPGTPLGGVHTVAELKQIAATLK